MASFLRQIQRSKSGKPQEDRQAVVRSAPRPDETSDIDDEFLLNTGFDADEPRGAVMPVKAGRSDEPLTAGFAEPAGSTGEAAGKRPAGEQTPWWFLETVERNPQAEPVIARVIPLLDQASLTPGPALRQQIEALVAQAAGSLKDEVRVTRKLLEQIEQELVKLISGFGPLEPLVEDTLVSEVFVDSHRTIRVMRNGQVADTPFSFRSPEEYHVFAASLLRRLGRELTPLEPVVEGVLPDRWRTHCSILHASITDGGEPHLGFRFARQQATSFFDLLQQKAMSATVAAWLAELVAMSQANVLVAGRDRAGRALFASAFASAVGSDERIALVEAAPVFSVTTAHVERVHPLSGVAGASIPVLLQAMEHRGPHRIMAGDITGGDALALVRTLERGFHGSILTTPAESAEESLLGLLDACLEQSMAPVESLVRRISRVVQLIVFTRLVDGHPVLDTIAEVLAPAGSSFRIRPLVRFHGVANGKRQWQLQTKQSHWIAAVRERGAALVPGPGLLPPPAQEHRGVTVELKEELRKDADDGSTGGTA